MVRRLMRLGLSHVAAILAAGLIVIALPGSAGLQAAPAHDPGNLRGKLLVAAPSMNDPNFKQTVIFMIEHDEHGALGIVLNRVLGAAPAAEVLKGLGVDADGASGQMRVFLGGPVQPEVTFVLHSTDYENSDTHKIVDGAAGISVTGDASILEAISQGKGPHKSLIALGYSGWGPGQLEAEIAHDAWYVAPVDPDVVFGEDVDAKWKHALATSGVDL